MANEAKQFTIGGVTHDVMDVGARQAIASLQNAIDAITSGDTTTAIKTFQEVIDFLDGVTDDATLIGKLNELRTLINEKYSKPASGIPASDLANGVIPDVSVFATKSELNAKANSADVVPNSRTINGKALSSNVTIGMSDIQGLETAIADAGKVKSVSVNGGTHEQPDAQGNVNISVVASKGDDGITPHIDALTGNWFIGNTDTQVKAQGPKGDSGVVSGDGVVVVNDTSGEPVEIEEGQVAVLGAGVGKYIADRAIPTSGTFADAYDKAKANSSVVFPWMLIDEDESGEPVKKMMWHVGNREFIDAIGGKVDGVKNGVTVTTDAAGYMRIWDTVQYTLQTSKWYDYEIHVGENNFSFDEIGGNSHVFMEFLNSDKSGSLGSEITSIDFGGMTLTTAWSSDSSARANLCAGFSKLKYAKRLNMYPSVGATNTNLMNWFSQNSKLEYLQVGGTVTKGTLQGWLQQSRSLVKLDLSQLSMSITSCRTGFNFLLSYKLEYIDIRGIDFSGGTSIASFLSCPTGNVVKTVVVGNIDTSSVTASSSFCNNINNATLVCTQDTPSGWGVDIIAGHFTSIKVPNKTVDVEGTATAVIDLYKSANGWSTYADIMSTYEEGEY